MSCRIKMNVIYRACMDLCIMGLKARTVSLTNEMRALPVHPIIKVVMTFELGGGGQGRP